MVEEVLRAIERELKDDDVHGLGHALRVKKIARRIALEEGADVEVVEIASLLHDIARGVEGDHAEVGAEMARRILEDLGYDKVEEVVHAIRAHRFKGGIEARTLEARILQDADRIDALGAVGIYRAICHGCEVGRRLRDTLNHIREKLLKIPETLNTDAGRRMAKERLEFVLSFLEEIERELI